MTKGEYLKEAKRMINIMNGNNFLLPNSWSDLIDIDLKEWSYKTYCSRDGRLYIHLEIHEENKKILDFHFIGDEITVASEFGINITAKKMHDYIMCIYDEKHSFSEHNEGLKDLRKKIRYEKETIKRSKSTIEELENQVKGLKELQLSQ